MGSLAAPLPACYPSRPGRVCSNGGRVRFARRVWRPDLHGDRGDGTKEPRTGALPMRRRSLHPLLLAATLILLAGCESKFNRQNFAMIRIGMDNREDVRQILGEPDADMDDVWMYDDLDHHHSAQIFFDEDGRVLNKEWMDAETGKWEGENPWADQPAKGEVRERHTKTRRIDDD